MSNEHIVTYYRDRSGDVTSIKVGEEITRCKDCNQSEEMETPFVRNCCVWNKLVPLAGYCFLGNKEVKHEKQ